MVNKERHWNSFMNKQLKCGCSPNTPESDLCERCKEKAIHYAEAMIRRDQALRHIGHERHDFDSFGQPLKGSPHE